MEIIIKKKLFYITGITPEGRYTISGVYNFYETYGMPLDMIFEKLFFEMNCCPDWKVFYNDARKAGISHSKIITKIEEALKYVIKKETFIKKIG